MEESVQFPLENNRVKPGTVLIETVLSGDSLQIHLSKIYTLCSFVVDSCCPLVSVLLRTLQRMYTLMTASLVDIPELLEASGWEIIDCWLLKSPNLPRRKGGKSFRSNGELNYQHKILETLARPFLMFFLFTVCLV